MAYAINFVIDPDFKKKLRNAQISGVTDQAKAVALEARRLIMSKRNARARDLASGRSENTGKRSLPGGLPRSDTGNYKRSIKYVRKGTVAFVGPTWPKGAHAGMLKWGTKKMAPRLVPSELALQESQNRLSALFKDRL